MNAMVISKVTLSRGPQMLKQLVLNSISPSLDCKLGALRRFTQTLFRLVVIGIVLDWIRQVARLKLGLLGASRGPFPLPLLGTSWRFLTKGVSTLHQQALVDFRDFGKMHSWAHFHKSMFSSMCPHHLRRMLVTHWKRYDRSDVEQAAFGELLGRGLIFVENARWGEMRRMYQSGFSDGNIIAFKGLLRTWSEDFARGLLVSGADRQIDIQAATQRLTFRVVGLFTLGVDFEEASRLSNLKEKMSPGPWPCENYGELWFRLLEHTQDRFFFGPFHWWRVLKTPHVRAFERGLSLLLEEIEKAFHARLNGDRPAHPGLSPSFNDLVSLILQGSKGKQFSREEMHHQALTFLFAGHDTTTNLISWCLYLLAERPEMLERARDEAQHVDAAKPFLQCCLLETLRLYPSVPIRSRTVSERDVFTATEPRTCPLLNNPNKVCLERGVGAIFSINALHRDPDHWPEPDRFDPYRFEEHVSKSGSALPTSPRIADETQPLTYIPFGAGPRRCIGERFALLEAEEICSAVLRHCRLACPPGPPPVDEIKLTLRARDGIYLLISRHPEP